ncbi:hypothetical protein GCM10011376_18980 [Nocardioides flavus (ex Wang et al. 2016)]|uniref:Glycosyltransferase RgtA/B/C/D-like domain-containing protein n=1 Tax=Nocardioides flavus (ex Wang et al. 2016) TaxID=2058780 RepID=A0ABQ3HI18_9ACTN|nr:hypothetical protein [Nocardioides flavus (ex Wang et al. 2016)]GHE17288.1 hypothetical protein GCM10011376_18980 [Nocardioides flavus (ex Wang et al. 2016)]
MSLVTVTALVLTKVADAPLRQQGIAAALLLLFAGSAAVVSWRLSEGSSRPTGWVTTVPACWVFAWGVAQLALQGPDAVEWFLGGDNVRHVGTVAEIVSTGDLTYADTAYPRAWHTVIALAWVFGGAALDESRILSFVLLNATSTWILFALLVLASSNLANAIAQRLQSQGWRAGAWAAALAGCWMMTPRFMADTLALGFQTTILAAIVLAVAARECVVGRTNRLNGYMVWVALVVLMAHTWQLLIPAVVVPAAVHGWRVAVSDAQARGRVLVLTSLGALGAAPPFLSAYTGPGIAASAAPGVSPVPSWLVLLASVIATMIVIRQLPRAEATGLGGVVLAPMLVGVAISGVLATSITSYYPSKLLWHTAAVGLGLFAVVTVSFVARAARAGPALRIGGVTIGTLASAFGLWGLVTPLGSQIHAWSTVDGQRVMSALEIPGSSEAQGVWMNTDTETAVTRTLIASLRGVALAADRMSVAEECAAMRESPSPVVVTSKSATAAHRRYDCVDGLQVITVHR